MIIIFAAIAKRAIEAVGSCVIWCKAFRTELGSAAYDTAVSGSAVGAYILIDVMVHVFG